METSWNSPHMSYSHKSIVQACYHMQTPTLTMGMVTPRSPVIAHRSIGCLVHTCRDVVISSLLFGCCALRLLNQHLLGHYPTRVAHLVDNAPTGLKIVYLNTVMFLHDRGTSSPSASSHASPSRSYDFASLASLRISCSCKASASCFPKTAVNKYCQMQWATLALLYLRILSVWWSALPHG